MDVLQNLHPYTLEPIELQNIYGPGTTLTTGYRIYLKGKLHITIVSISENMAKSIVAALNEAYEQGWLEGHSDGWHGRGKVK